MAIAAVISLLIASSMSADSPRIFAINFYGYAGLDLAQLRLALPFHEGDSMPSREELTRAREPFAKAIGRKQVKFTPNMISGGRLLLFVGIAEPGFPPFKFEPRPQGDERLPESILRLEKDHAREIVEAVRQGQNSEDVSQGYRLLAYPPARALELEIRTYARAHAADLIQVLRNSADDAHRAVAADALGYVVESSEQIAVLVQAAFDANAEVRDNALRALGILIDHDPRILQRIPLEKFLALLHSINWLDRNKGADLIEAFTRARDPEVLRLVRSQALAQLCEIVQWKDFSHALSAFEALGRIAGWEEGRIDELSSKEDVGSVLQAVQARP